MKSGVLVLAGTDVNNPFCVPGFGLQQELVNLHEAGLTNLEVLQTATINAAKFLYKEKQLGTVEAGKFADLVVLDADHLFEGHTTWIGFRRGALLRAYMYEFIELLAAHLPRKLVRDAEKMETQQEVDRLLEDVQLPLRDVP